MTAIFDKVYVTYEVREFGILALLVEKSLLDIADGDQLLNQLIAEGYRSPYISLTEFLHEI